MPLLASIVDAAPKFTFVAFFTTALCALVFGWLNYRLTCRKELESRLSAHLARPEFWARVDALGAADPNRLVFDEDLRRQALEWLPEMRRLAKGTSYPDWDHACGGPNFHRICKAVSACRILIQVVRRTDLFVHPHPVWNGHRTRFCNELLRALKIEA
ncbi:MULTISPECIES: hypothetical protein [Methylosinus]|uniref:Uncharacterized protein n=1 Tax=Methylosinus trichosporium (strain ATCC 35070 / NCIMB 11131 / UNIQEM 75 / OB3b) TaxID=595536 RepID=A0A2D2D1L0_METT3|nr:MULTISPECIES: hypothetical protein [Methylosinus]ATQ68854.1 hypothetical protein CQW49_13900 [Methylosinus trichosporium OB3b]OBS52040.1 hypothetical protein A8B73_13100 [Methylosinus sp. 3S-1]